MTTTSSSILGQYEASQTGTTDRVASDKDTFLKLLVAQLTHQDPLNPQEDSEFIAQLAQFTQVEELQKISSGMDTLNQNYLNSQVSTAVGFLGAYVSAKGDYVTLVNGRTNSSEITMTLPRDAENVTVRVLATDADGNPTYEVFSESLGAYSEGSLRYEWSGYSSSGSRCANGRYMVSVSATDADGKSMLVDTSSIGQVIAIETTDDGNHLLWLEDGRKVNLNDVEMVSGYNLNGGNATDDGSDGADGDDDGDGGTDDSGATGGDDDDDSGG